jgi:hypothetical protein
LNNIYKQANNEHIRNKERQSQKFIEDQARVEYPVENIKRKNGVRPIERFSDKQITRRRHKEAQDERKKIELKLLGTKIICQILIE